MSFRIGHRNERVLFPPSLEEAIADSDQVRVYDAFVESLDFDSLGLKLDARRVGAPYYDPVAMLKLLVYGYAYGIRSSRKLERACRHNVSFMWLVGGLTPGYKAISEFRRNNKSVLKEVLKQCTRVCMKLGLIEGNMLFLDSSKMRANASMEKSWSQKRCRKFLENLDERVEELLNSSDAIDDSEKDLDSLVDLDDELADKLKLGEKVKSILWDLEKEKKSSQNMTDSDSVNTKGRQGSFAGYTAQVVTDGENGLIVSADAVSQSNDTNQFSHQIKGAEEVTGKRTKVAVADSGYSQTDDLADISFRKSEEESDKSAAELCSSRPADTQVVVPNREQARRKKSQKAFSKEEFTYDKKTDEYICPIGRRLPFYRHLEKKKSNEYRSKSQETCGSCPHKDACTKSKHGRTISRLVNEEYREKLAEFYESKEGQKIYALRKQKSELPFGFFKRNLGAGYFLLRGRDGVNAELSLFATCFNLTRAISLLGISGLMAKLMGT